MAGFFEASLDPAQPDSYEAIQRKRKLAEALMKQGTDTAPVQSWTQGVARLMQALAGKLSEKELDAKEAAANKAFQEQFLSAYTPASASSAGSAAPAATSGAPAASSPPTASAAAPTKFDPNALPTFAKAAGDQFGVSPDYMAKTAWIESRFNPQADNGVAKGMYQFIPSTAKAYGLADPFDAQASATAAARLAADNRDALSRSLGRAPNDAELYLAHQQGAGGAAKLLANPNAPAASIVGRQAVIQNGGRPDMTAGEFANLWIGKFNALQPKGAGNNASAQQPSSAMAYAPANGQVPPEAAAAIPVGLPPGAVPQNAQPAPTQPDPALLAATAARAANPQPGDQMAALGSPEEQAFTRIEGQPGAAGRSGLAAALAGSGTSPGVQPRIDNVTPTAAGSGVRFSNSADDVKQPVPSTSAAPAPSDRSRALLMMALNPALSPSQRQMASAAFTQMQGQDKVTYQTDGEGNVIALDPFGRKPPQVVYKATPKPMIVPEGGSIYEPGKGMVAGGGPKQTDAIRNYQFYVQQENAAGRQPKNMDQWQTDQKKAGATTIGIDTKGQAGMQTKAIDGFDTAVKAGVDANRRIASYGQLAQAMQGFTPGATAEARVKAKSILKDMGVIEGADVPDAEAFKRVQRQLEIAATPKGQGQITENERVLIRELIPQIGNSPEGIAKIVGQLKQLDDYDLKVADIYRANARKNGGVPNYLEVSDEVAQLGPPMTDAQMGALKGLLQPKSTTPDAAASAAASTSTPRWRIVQ